MDLMELVAILSFKLGIIYEILNKFYLISFNFFTLP